MVQLGPVYAYHFFWVGLSVEKALEDISSAYLNNLTIHLHNPTYHRIVVLANQILQLQAPLHSKEGANQLRQGEIPREIIVQFEAFVSSDQLLWDAEGVRLG